MLFKYFNSPSKLSVVVFTFAVCMLDTADLLAFDYAENKVNQAQEKSDHSEKKIRQKSAIKDNKNALLRLSYERYAEQETVRFIRVIDLEAPKLAEKNKGDKAEKSTRINFRSNGQVHAMGKAISEAVQPAILLSKQTEDGANLVVLTVLPSGVAVIMDEPLRRFSEKHGGFSTIDSIHLNWRYPCQPFPEIMLIQTSLPAKGDKEFRPGPPLEVRYFYDEQTNQYKHRR